VGSIEKMSGSIRKHELVKAVAEGLKSIQAIMEKSGEGFTSEGVGSIGKTCKGLLDQIDGKTNE
jgi:hypothetical protein